MIDLLEVYTRIKTITSIEMSNASYKLKKLIESELEELEKKKEE